MKTIIPLLVVMMLNGCASWTYYQQRTVLLKGDVLVTPDKLVTCVKRTAPPTLVVRASVALSDGLSLWFSEGSRVDIERMSTGSTYTILGGPRPAGKVISGVMDRCGRLHGQPSASSAVPEKLA